MIHFAHSQFIFIHNCHAHCLCTLADVVKGHPAQVARGIAGHALCNGTEARGYEQSPGEHHQSVNCNPLRVDSIMRAALYNESGCVHVTTVQQSPSRKSGVPISCHHDGWNGQDGNSPEEAVLVIVVHALPTGTTN